jgi:polyphosphate kinase
MKPNSPGAVQQAEAQAPDDLKNPAYYINRELGWLSFNQRVLAQARDACHPLLERVRFLGITGANLDEFFMIRVAVTLRKLREGLEDNPADGLTTSEQLRLMRQGASDLLAEQSHAWRDLRAALEQEGIVVVEPANWSSAVHEYLQTHFRAQIFPALTPLAFDPGHPFPFISNLSTNLAVAVRHGGRTKFARVKVPRSLPRFVQLPPEHCAAGQSTFVFVEDVIKANVQALFPGASVRAAHLFRIVRDSDLEIDEVVDEDLLLTVDRGLRQIRRGALSLLQVEQDMSARVLDILVENFGVSDDVVMRTSDRLGFADWTSLFALHRPDLKYKPFNAPGVWEPEEDPEGVFDLIRYQDVIVHHPFESFDSVETFIRAAVADPSVLAIKMTLYRIGPHSPLVPLLIEASESGKQVAVLVELKARFDERNNINWARRLESHGIHVSYGFANVKTHAKLCLVVRQGLHGVEQFVHTGTGNYNPTTARQYTDIGLITSDPLIVSDANEVFNSLTGYAEQASFRSLLVAPRQLRRQLGELIDREIAHARDGRSARMIMKVNALTDDRTIRHLYRASRAGVDIDLIVRGVCCLRPGIAGVSDRIRVRSIVGRFLEHSRLYWFQNGGSDELFIGSADLMERNLDRRVEVLCPIRDPEILAHLRDIVLSAYLKDNVRAHVLDADGQYARPSASEPFDAQAFLLGHYGERASD